MIQRLLTALQTLQTMRAPSVETILRDHGYEYEARCVHEVYEATTEYKNSRKKKNNEQED